MGSYILNFTVYTMAMCGLICFALFVYKKFALTNFLTKNSQYLNVEETLSLAPRKMLYIIRAGEERFLIASDADKTTLISKLEDGNIQKALNTDKPLDFDVQLNHTRPTEQKIQKPVQQERGYTQQKQQSQYPLSRQPKRDLEEKMTYIEVDDFPKIDTTRKSKGSKDVIKSMVNRVKG